MAKAQVNVYKLPWVRGLFRKAYNLTLPGLNGATLYEVGKFFVAEMKTLKLQERAAAVTYNFLMAMAPSFLFLLSLLPFLPFKNVDKTIFGILRLVTPNRNIYLSVRNIVTDFMATQHAGALSYGIILVLFFSSNGVMGLMRCFDNSLLLYKKRTGLQRRWTAIKLTIMLICLGIVTIAVFVIQSKTLNHYILDIFHNIVAVKILSFIILILLVFISISIIYTYGPSLTERFRFISAGSVFATVVSILATSVFFFLVNNILYYNKIYGSIGTLIAFMVWVWLNTIIILMGYELNVAILLGKLSKEETNEEE